MTEYLIEEFEERLKKALALIKAYGINYERIGLFGSYARGDCNGSSDIDLALVVIEKPDRAISGSLREDCELLGVDIVFVTPQFLKNGATRFAKKLRRDWRELNEKQLL